MSVLGGRVIGAWKDSVSLPVARPCCPCCPMRRCTALPQVSSYMEVNEAMGGAMQKNVRCNLKLLQVCASLLAECNRVFAAWYQELHGAGSIEELTRLQSFVTRSPWLFLFIDASWPSFLPPCVPPIL